MGDNDYYSLMVVATDSDRACDRVSSATKHKQTVNHRHSLGHALSAE